MLPGGQTALCVALLLSVASGIAAAEDGRTDDGKIELPAAPIATDWRTGLAIHGVDPVAYFSDGHAVEGQGAWELRYAGAVWRFRTEANRAAFAADPEVYMPRFSGHDAVALARGVWLDGNPRLWLVFGQRLYLFHTPEARAAFLADPRGVLARAAQMSASLVH